MKKIALILLIVCSAVPLRSMDPRRDTSPKNQNNPTQKSLGKTVGLFAGAVGCWFVSYHGCGAVKNHISQQAKAAKTPAHITTVVAFNSCLLAGSAIGLYWGSKMAYWSIKSFLGKP